jgi:hypothetical protein
MAWKGIVESSRNGIGMTVEQFRAHVAGLQFGPWRPSSLTLHNTGAPRLDQWHPAASRIKNLEHYYRDIQGWSAGPHVFVADDLIWPFTPFTAPGVHSPSFNGVAWGMEMVGDYSVEAFDSGPGARVRDNAVAACAILHARLGLDPHTLRLHKEDKRTTHDCPGRNVNKEEFIRRVVEYIGEGGEHPRADLSPRPQVVARNGVVKTAGLNLRAASSAASAILASLTDGTKLSVLGSAANGNTEWLRVDVPALGKSGWVAAQHVTL